MPDHKKRRERQSARQREEAIATALTLVARETEAVFFAVPHFIRTLMAPAKSALVYLEDCLEAVPTQVVLAPDRLDRDPTLNILFNNEQDITDLIKNSKHLRAFFETQGRMEAVALLEAEWHQKTIMGVDNDGGVIKRDVPRTAFFFENHSLHDIGATLTEARERFCFRILGQLVSTVAEEIEGLRQWCRDLENERDMLKLRLRHAAGSGAPADARTLLTEIETKIRGLKRQMGSRDDQLGIVANVLSNPEPLFSILPVSLHLNQLGIQVRADSHDPAFDITLAKCTLPDQSQKAVLWAHIHR